MRKIFAFAFIISCSMGHSYAEAGWRECMSALLNPLLNPQPKPKLHIKEAHEYYQKFLQLRAANPLLLPPAAEVTEETTLHDKFFGFLYWWLPGNIWNGLMSAHYSGNHMYREYKRDGGKPLKYADMPEPAKNDASLNIAEFLPNPPPGRLSYRLKTRAEAEYNAYKRERETDRAAVPKFERAKDDTPAENIYHSFGFWWFPGNVFHSRVAAQHDVLAAQIFESHIMDEYKFPEPPVFRENEAMEVAPTYDNDHNSVPAAFSGVKSAPNVRL